MKFKPSDNAFTPLFPKAEHDRILADTIDEYEQKMSQTVTKLVHERYISESTIAFEEAKKDFTK